jgi:hypothetical protein
MTVVDVGWGDGMCIEVAMNVCNATPIWSSVRPLAGGKLVIVGDGTERDHLGGLAGGDVELVGHVDEEGSTI